MKISIDRGIDAIIDNEEINRNITQLDNQTSIIWKYAQQVNKYMADLRQVATEDNDMGSSTITKVFIFGIISISVIIISAVVQILYLKRFFREKKIM